MANWLQKFLSPPANTKRRGYNVPMKMGSRSVMSQRRVMASPPLPKASVIYAVAASVLIVAALSLGFSGSWFSALLVLLPAACFLGFAVHFIRHQ